MSKTIDEKVVEMRFDNRQFEEGVKTSMSTLDKLKHSLNLDGASKGLKNLGDAARSCDMSGLSKGIETVHAKFSALEVIGVTALANLTNSALNAGKSIASALTIEPVKTGFEEYETKIGSIQTIMSNTASKGSTLEDVTRVLDELNLYADKTIYNFAEMTRNIGTFTAAGVGLEDAATAIQGIANLAASSGSTSQQASTAMYQLSQALAAGEVKLMDWNSVVNAGMGGEKFQEALKATAREFGVAVDEMIEKNGSFRESLKDGWITADVMNTTLKKFTVEGAAQYAKGMLESGKYTQAQADALMAEAQAMEDAATKVKTLTQLWDTLKEAAQSGWSQSWETIVGDFGEAKEFFTEVSDTLGALIQASADARNAVLDGWKDLGGRTALIDSIRNTFDGIMSIITPIKEAFREIFPPATAQQLVNITNALKEFTAKIKLTDENADKLKRTCKGLFALIDTFRMVIGDTLKAVLTGLGKLLGKVDLDILGITASIGDAIVRFRDWVREHNALAKSVEAIIGFLTKAVTAVKSWAKAFMELPQVQEGIEILGKTLDKLKVFFAGGIEQIVEFVKRVRAMDSVSLDNIGDVFKDFRDNVLGYFLDIGSCFDGFADVLRHFKDNVAGFIRSIGDWFRSLIEHLQQFRTSAAEHISAVGVVLESLKEKLFEFWSAAREKFSGRIGLGEIFAIGISATFLLFVKKIHDFVGSLRELTESISKLLENIGKSISGFIDSITSVVSAFASAINAYASKMKTEALLNVAKAILILVSAVVVLTQLDQNKLWSAVGALGALAAGLLVVSAVLGAVGKLGDFGKMSASILGIAASMYILVEVMKKLKDLDGESIWGKAGILAALGAGLVAFAGILSRVAPNLSKGMLSLLVLSISLRAIIGGLKELNQFNPTGSGKAVLALTGIVGNLIVLSVACQNLKLNSTAGVLAIAAALKLMVSALDDICSLDTGRIKGNIGAFIVVFGSLVALMAAGRNAGEHSTKAGVALLATSAALLIIVQVMKQIISMDSIDLSKATKTIAKVLLVFAGVVAVSKFAGEHAAKAGVMLLLMSTALLILSGVIVILTHLEPNGLDKAVATIAKLELVFAALIAVTKLASDCKSTIIALSVAVGVLSATIAGLSLINQENLAAASKSLSLVVALFSILVASTGLTKKATATLLVLTACVSALAMVLAGLSLLPVENTQATVNVLGKLMLALAATLIIVSNAKTVAPSAYATLGVMVLVVAGLAVILGALASMNVGPTLEIAKSLSILLLSLAGACAILSVVGTAGAAAFVGIGALVTLVSAMGGLMAALGALTEYFPMLEVFLDKGVTILENIGYGLGSFIGSIAGGVIAGISSGLPKIGSELSEFMENSRAFFDEIQNVSAESLHGAKAIAETILILTGVDIINGLKAFLTGKASFGDFAEGLSSFGRAVKAYADEVAGLDTEAVTNSTVAGKAVAELAKTLPNSGGLVGVIVGNNDMGAFADGLTRFGRAVKSYAREVTGLDTETVTNSTVAGKAVAELAKTLPNSGGLLGVIFGNNDMDKFAEGLIPFGRAMKGYAAAVSGMDTNAVTNSATAGEALVELARTVPNCGGLVSFFTGNNSLDDFGNDIVVFGTALSRYSIAIQNVRPDIVTASANAAGALASLASGLPDSSILSRWFGGNNSLASFGMEIAKFGESMSYYYARVSGINTSKLSVVVKSVWELVDLAKGLADVNTKNLEAFGKSLKVMADTGIREFVAAFTSCDTEVEDAVQSMLSSANKSISESKDITTPGMEEVILSLADTISDKISVIEKSTDDMMRKLEKEIENHERSAQTSMGTVIDGTVDAINSTRPRFEAAGKNVSQGFINGINSKLDSAGEAGKRLGQAALEAAQKALDSHSPSRKFIKLGENTDEGFAAGVKNKISSVTSAASDMLGQFTSQSEQLLEEWMSKQGYFSGDGLMEELAGLNIFQGEYMQGIEERLKGDADAARIRKQLESSTYQESIDWIDKEKYYDRLSREEELVGWETLQSKYAQGTEEREKADKEAYRVKKELASDAYQSSLDWIEEEKYYNRLGLEEELAVWKRLQSQYKKGSEERKKIDREVYRVQNELVAATYQSSVDWIEKEKYYNRLSLEEELAAWERIQSSYLEGSEEREKADREVYRLKKELAEEAYQFSLDWIEREKYYNRLSLKEELAAWERVQSRYLAGSKEREKADREVYRVKKELAEEAYQFSLDWIEREKYYNRLSLEEELAAWERVQKRYIAGSKEREKADREIYRLEKEIAQARYQLSLDWIEREKTYDRLTLVEELAAWKRVQKRYRSGTEERKRADKEVYQLEKQIYEARKKYADDVAELETKRLQDVSDAREQYDADALALQAETAQKRLELEQEYADKVKGINEKLAQDIESLNNEYLDAVASRTGTLYQSYGLFDEVARKEEVDGKALVKNLKDQVNEFSDWRRVLNQLASKGLDDELIGELQQMGPSSLAELKALNSLSVSELSKYANLWEIKHTQARQQALDELEGLRTDTGNKIALLRIDADAELQEYKEVWKASMNEVNETANADLDKLKEDFDAKLSEINTTAGSELRTLKDTFAKELGLVKDDVEKQMKEIVDVSNRVLRDAGWDEAGQQAVDGLTKGVASRRPSFIDEVTKLAASGVDAIRQTWDMHSPSRVWYGLGSFAGLGLVNALHDYAGRSYQAGAEVADEAANGLSDAMTKISAMLQNGFDENPTIRPVVDLTDVSRGMRSLDGLLGSKTVMAGLTFGNGAKEIITIDTGSIVQAIQELRGDVTTLGSAVQKMQVVLDTGALVGQLEEPIDSALGKKVIHKGRGM